MSRQFFQMSRQMSRTGVGSYKAFGTYTRNGTQGGLGHTKLAVIHRK